MNLNSGSRRSALTMIRSYLRMGGRFEDGGILADGDLEPAGVLQRAGQVQCLVAVTVVLALPARKQEDLGAIGHFLLSGRPAASSSRTRITLKATIRESTHGRCSCLRGFVGRIPALRCWSSGVIRYD